MVAGELCQSYAGDRDVLIPFGTSLWQLHLWQLIGEGCRRWTLPVVSRRWGCFCLFLGHCCGSCSGDSWPEGGGRGFAGELCQSYPGDGDVFASVWDTIVEVTIVKVDWGGMAGDELCRQCPLLALLVRGPQMVWECGCGQNELEACTTLAYAHIN